MPSFAILRFENDIQASIDFTVAITAEQ